MGTCGLRVLGPGTLSHPFFRGSAVGSRARIWVPKSHCAGDTGNDSLQTLLLGTQLRALRYYLVLALHVTSEATVKLTCGMSF